MSNYLNISNLCLFFIVYYEFFGLSFFPNPNHSIKFGGVLTLHRFTPGNASASSGDVDFNTGVRKKLRSQEIGIYLLDDFEIGNRIRINAGLRYNYFNHIGPYDDFIKDQNNTTIDTVHYKKGKKVADYHRLEPRISLRYAVGLSSSFKAAFTQNYQNVHLASFATVSFPTDTWVPSTARIKPQLSRQYSLGYYRNFKKNTWETSAELYYKNMENLIEYKDGSLVEDNVAENIDNSFTFGSGDSYGIEFLVKKRKGRTTGWVGYTISKTTRSFQELNKGQSFPSRFDRRHDLSVVVTHRVNRKWKISGILVYGTGNSFTIPSSFFTFDGKLVAEAGERNGYRLPEYHRLDVSATLKGKESRRFSSSWTFSIFNLYNRRNPYFISFQEDGDYFSPDLQIKATQVSLFAFLPSVTWNFKFK